MAFLGGRVGEGLGRYTHNIEDCLHHETIGPEENLVLWNLLVSVPFKRNINLYLA
jgi:hypothetical protein